MKVKILMAFILGLSIALFVGAATENKPVGAYVSTFSGITPEGACYLAVTNTITGQTEIFGIPKEVLIKVGREALNVTPQGTAIVKPTQ